MVKKSHNSNSSDTPRKSEVTDTHNYLTVAQVAEKLQVSKDYIRTLVKNGHLETHVINNINLLINHIYLYIRVLDSPSRQNRRVIARSMETAAKKRNEGRRNTAA